MEMMLTVWVHGLAWRRYKRLTQNGKYQTPLNFLTTENLVKQQGETSKIIRRRGRGVTTHLETSLIRTFRVGEEEVEVEDPGEEATNLIIEVGEDLHTVKGIDPPMAQIVEETESTENGMKARLQDPAQVSHMKKGCGRIIKTRWGTVRRGMIENPKATILKSMKIGRELEAQVQEGRDPAEGTWHLIGETTAKIGGETPT